MIDNNSIAIVTFFVRTTKNIRLAPTVTVISKKSNNFLSLSVHAKFYEQNKSH